MLHKGDRFRFVASQGLKIKHNVTIKHTNIYYIIYSNLLLVEDTEYLTESQSERQCPHLDGSIMLIIARNLLDFHGSQVGIMVSLTLGRYQGIHSVRLKARSM